VLELLFSSIANFILNTISHLGYFGIFLTMLIESASIPLPSEIIMPFSGFLISEGKFNFYLVVFIGALGNLAGSIIMYAFGFWGQEAVVRKFVRGWGRFLINEEELVAGEKWFRKYGEAVILLSRITPVIRTFISLPAGVVKINFAKFCFLTFIGSLIWSALLTFIGIKLGENWNVIEPFFRKFDIVIIGSGIILLIAYIVFKYRKVSYDKKDIAN